MEIQSLAVGNYLKKEGIIVQIDARTIFDIYDNDGFKKLGYEPITIHFEELKRLGFVFDEISEDAIYEDQSFRIACKGEFVIELDMNWDSLKIYNPNIRREYKYIHELQNIYYLITGEQLIFIK